MPYVHEHVAAEVLLDYKGIQVYYTYKNDNADDALLYSYTLLEDNEREEFDIRELPNWGGNAPGKPSPKDWRTRETHAAVIREAIDHEYLTERIERAGYEDPRLIEWPIMIRDVGELHYWQLKQLVHSYDAYIQRANEEDMYQSGWKPVSVNEYYGAEFRMELKDELKEGQTI